jgi:uncharacterized membrane protein
VPAQASSVYGRLSALQGHELEELSEAAVATVDDDHEEFVALLRCVLRLRPVPKEDLPNMQQAVLQVVRANGGIPLSHIAQTVRRSRPQIHKVLRKLQARGQVIQEGTVWR